MEGKNWSFFDFDFQITIYSCAIPFPKQTLHRPQTAEKQKQHWQSLFYKWDKVKKTEQRRSKKTTK